MRRPLLTFLGAVLLPGILLGSLAWNSIRSQESARDHERSRVLLGFAEQLAQAVVRRIDDHQREFSLRVESLLGKESPTQLAQGFDDRIRDHWPLANLGFAVRLSGDLLAPPILGRPEARQFLVNNNDFLCNRSGVQVFAVTPKGKINLSDLPVPASPEGDSDDDPPTNRRFAQLIGDAQEGVLARFVNDSLVVWVWYRTPREPDVVFGAQLGLATLHRSLSQLVQSIPPPMPGVAFALLDERSRVIGAVPPSSTHLPWGSPVASALVGPSLPNWRVAATIADPGQFHLESRRLRLTLALVIVLLVAAIAAGGYLVATDARRQLDVARRKTDFVSSVSHELKTPLTSIHLFAELLSEDRVTDPAKRRQHLGIIRAEAGRLHRLIANILDFARHERGEHRLRLQPVDLAALVREVLVSFGPQLSVDGLQVRFEPSVEPCRVHADPDSLAQILNNLLSNAAKYAASGGEITVAITRDGDGSNTRLDVLDRGPGIPAACADRIFEEFFRADDVLSAGIPGAGLGLTLARRLARANGGDLSYHPRAGGGSLFRLRLPTQPPPCTAPSPSQHLHEPAINHEAHEGHEVRAKGGHPIDPPSS
ncbi:MAG: sensor histidine kinase [Limisphaerales bacterium]